MGIVFITVEAADQEILEKWLADERRKPIIPLQRF